MKKEEPIPKGQFSLSEFRQNSGGARHLYLF